MEGSEGMANIRWRVIVREVLRYYWRKGQQIIVNKRKLGGKGERKRRNQKKKSGERHKHNSDAIPIPIFAFLAEERAEGPSVTPEESHDNPCQRPSPDRILLFQDEW